MSKPVVAIDVDGVLFPFHEMFIRHHDKLYGTDLQLAKWQSYDMSVFLETSSEVAVDKVDKFFEDQDYHLTQPIEGAVEALNRLKQSYELVVVTARPAKISKLTAKWLDHYFEGVFTDAYFASNFSADHTAVGKLELCVMAEAGVLIDDSLEFIAEVAAKGIRGILFSDSPWNQGKLPAGVSRAKDWEAVVKKLSNG